MALFRAIRLKALQDSPEAFCSTYDSALERDFQSWQDQLWSTTAGELRNTQFAFIESECVGIAALYRESISDDGEIIMMWVDPRYRGSSAASSLVKNLEAWAKDVGCSEVSL